MTVEATFPVVTMMAYVVHTMPEGDGTKSFSHQYQDFFSGYFPHHPRAVWNYFMLDVDGVATLRDRDIPLTGWHVGYDRAKDILTVSTPRGPINLTRGEDGKPAFAE